MEPTLSALERDLHTIAGAALPTALAADESFWQKVRAEYALPDGFTHLEYGYYHPASRAVLAAEIAMMQVAQRRGSHYKRNEMEADREAARTDLARLGGVDAEEVVITRNATEALNIVIAGMPLSRGDEIVHSSQDYPSVIEALQQRAHRDGVVLKSVDLPSDPESDDEIISAFAAAVSPRTRVILFTHLINTTGHLLPLRRLCAFARQHSLHIIVDAAHSFGQIDFSVAEIDCDYLGASLHKWLGAPLGTGLLYVRRDRIERLNPFFGDTTHPRNNIRKLEHFGNRPDSAHVGLRQAIRWHDAIGLRNKGARLHYLQQRWADAARKLPRIQMLTPRDPARHGAIGAFSVDGVPAEVAAKMLFERDGLFVNVFTMAGISGVRVTPGLPTTSADIDRLVAALRRMVQK
jgi:selenocysteine lyase/cysteine desulfurase